MDLLNVSNERKRTQRAYIQTLHKIQENWVGWFSVDKDTNNIKLAFNQWIDQYVHREEHVSLTLKNVIQAWKARFQYFIPSYPGRSIILTYANDSAEIFSHNAKVDKEGIFDRDTGWNYLVSRENENDMIFIMTIDQKCYKLYEICENQIELRIQIDVKTNQRYAALKTFITSVKLYYSKMNGPLLAICKNKYNTELDCSILSANLNVQSFWQKENDCSLNDILYQFSTNEVLMNCRRQWIKMISKTANTSSKMIQNNKSLLESIKKDKLKYLMIPNHYIPKTDEIEIFEASFKKNIYIMKYDENILSGIKK